MADVERVVAVNAAARSPEERRQLFDKVSERHDPEAFRVLYDLYFGDMWARAFCSQERKAMQEVVLNLLDCVLDDFKNKDRHRAAAFLEATMTFLHNSDLFRLDLAASKIAGAMADERDAKVHNSLRKILIAIRERYQKAQAESEPE
ncbi:hypothetical protein A2661_02995 [Candidatus Giovannonibacteria bacterium RIFCSPHIGHO2_01_FULL_45_24]|uniref:Uncharacterized protein n=1 Tax=Candidatus Giovannonibacteria bacterium RIFCSPLOWO2_01_FULL_46_32 TaxID=1798353 RepID=A0A1F5XGI2_9BACT|nr:MAG: hypothetical protein A2661_02995 [Candidatus Giovannonibacteria bacterium RIFCSPHIGHO2_01_FULL_45_24]OGF86979.1 MAG: hypothetical protein A3B19_00915 [Candidatus Giovannonibacteria bacterium RIFCSPLOWO2_01_FULL_46_32]